MVLGKYALQKDVDFRKRKVLEILWYSFYLLFLDCTKKKKGKQNAYPVILYSCNVLGDLRVCVKNLHTLNIHDLMCTRRRGRLLHLVVRPIILRITLLPFFFFFTICNLILFYTKIKKGILHINTSIDHPILLFLNVVLRLTLQ